MPTAKEKKEFKAAQEKLATEQAAVKNQKEELQANIVEVKMTEQEEGNVEIRKGRVTEYEVPAAELGHVHVELEQVQIDSGFKKKSKPFVQKFDLRAWDNFRKNVVKLGYNHCKVLFAPEGVNIEIGDPRKDEKIKG